MNRLRASVISIGLPLALLFVAISAGAATTTFTGSVSATGVRWQSKTVTVTGSGQLTASLSWTAPTARLLLGLSHKNADGSWTWITGRKGAQPVTLTWPVTPGTWRLNVEALSGASAYTLQATYPHAAQPTPAPPYLTLLFSRSEITAADNCVEDNLDIARLDTVVAPELAARGLHPTGTVETGVTHDSTRSCLHWQETLGASWDDLAMLRDTYGWTFVSHSRTYAMNLSSLSATARWDETCGSLLDLQQHGHLRGDGLFAYPNNKWTVGVQTDPVSTCFAFGRRYGNGLTTRAVGTTPPYWQSTRGINGGRCHDAALPCSTLSTTVAYTSPVAVASALRTVQNNQWLTLQSYVLVTGSRPGMWDCTSANWEDHWATDAERYCWNDYKMILDSIPASVVVTDPKTVAEAWGRTNYTPPTIATYVPGLASR